MSELPSLKALRAFEATIRKGSVKDAARDLHVSDGAVSQQLRRLEQELGAALFRRTGRTLTPTRDAFVLAEALAGAFSTIGEAIQRFRQEHDHEPLQIVTLPSIATRLIVPALAQFRTHAPKVRLSFTYVHQPSEFELGSADVLLCTVDGPFRGVGKARVVLDGSVRPVCSPTYLKRIGRRLKPSDLAAADLLHDCDTVGWERWFRETNVAIQSSLTGDIYEDFGLLGSAALAGQGVALCPVELISQELSRGDLVVISDVPTLEERKYSVIVPETPRPDALVFADWVVSLGRGKGVGRRGKTEVRQGPRARSKARQSKPKRKLTG